MSTQLEKKCLKKLSKVMNRVAGRTQFEGEDAVFFLSPTPTLGFH